MHQLFFYRAISVVAIDHLPRQAQDMPKEPSNKGRCFLEAGHDKHWADNLILFPDHWAGDPCVQIWSGPEHHFVGNEVRLLLLNACFRPHSFPIKNKTNDDSPRQARDKRQDIQTNEAVLFSPLSLSHTAVRRRPRPR